MDNTTNRTDFLKAYNEVNDKRNKRIVEAVRDELVKAEKELFRHPLEDGSGDNFFEYVFDLLGQSEEFSNDLEYRVTANRMHVKSVKFPIFYVGSVIYCDTETKDLRLSSATAEIPEELCDHINAIAQQFYEGA